jgi:hypothetical protein
MREQPFSLARYDIHVDNYAASTWLASSPEASGHRVIVRLLGQKALFDGP